MKRRNPKPYIKEGRRSPPGTRCPYGWVKKMERHAWLAGHIDEHGFEAWEEARKL